jgi:tRNA threonylcarbamoyl adenosine modification protein (Sua5/YciO/YrdC/YwlC family)
MSQFFEIHPQNPQQRLIRRAVEIINKGGVIAFPTDSSYALGCHLGDKRALDRIRAVRRLDDKHNFTLICSDLTELSNFAKVGNDSFRLIKSLTPGPFTFVLKATKEVPKRLMHPKRKSVGLRIPDHPIAQALLQELGEPLFSTTLILPGDEESMSDPYEIRDRIEHEVDLVINAGDIAYEPTTIISMIDGDAEIVRQGVGIAEMLQ